jgi:hypothetical protein
MGEENERKNEKKKKKKKKKSVLIMWERKVKQNLVSGLLSENASSNLVSNFSHQIFLFKMVRLLEMVFQDFHQIGSPK